MDQLSPPHDLEAERAVLGAVLIDPTVIGQVSWQLTASDFYRPTHQAVFAAVAGFHERGERWDERTVLNACVAAGAPIEAVDLAELLASSGVAWRTHAERLVDLHARRELVYLANDATTAAQDASTDVAEVAGTLAGRLQLIHTPGSLIPDSFESADTIADRTVDHLPWIIPGMMRRGWRSVIVGPEGSGKSLLTLQCALLASAGIHPLHYKPIPPVVVVVVDLENPEEEVTSRIKGLRQQIQQQRGDWQAHRPFVWQQPGGIDLRSRKHRAQLDAMCATYQPDLVCIGPVYKSYEKRAGERGHEDAVRHVMAILDDLRTRHNFALMLEHHAPLDGNGSGKREIRPSDTMLWLRWPEIGIGMNPDPEHKVTVMHLKRWRGDRVKSSWPDRIEYGQAFPWVGVWKDPPRELGRSQGKELGPGGF